MPAPKYIKTGAQITISDDVAEYHGISASTTYEVVRVRPNPDDSQGPSQVSILDEDGDLYEILVDEDGETLVYDPLVDDDDDDDFDDDGDDLEEDDDLDLDDDDDDDDDDDEEEDDDDLDDAEEDDLDDEDEEEDENGEEICPGLYVNSPTDEILDWTAMISDDVNFIDDSDAIDKWLTDDSADLGVTLSAEEETLSIDELVERLAAERTKQTAQFRMKLALWGKCAIARKKGFA